MFPFVRRLSAFAAFFFALSLLVFTSVIADDSASDASKKATTDPSRLTLERIYQSGDFSGDGRFWTWDDQKDVLWRRLGKSDEGPALAIVDARSGDETIKLTAQQLTPDGHEKPLSISSYAWSDDWRYLVAFTNTTRVWRQNTRGNYWLWDRDAPTANWRRLGSSFPAQSLMFATLSPDASVVAYVVNQDGCHGLYTEDVRTGRVTPIATSDDPNIINGTFDWVYEEELGLRNGFRFSPDSRYLAFWQLDSTGVPLQTLIDNTS